MRRIAFTGFALICAVACQIAETELNDQRKAALADTIRVVHEKMMQRWLSADFDRVMPYFLNSPEVGWAWSGGVRYGYDDLAALFRPILDSFESADFAVGDRRVDVLARDAACVREYGAYSTTYATGMTRQRDPFVMTTIWVRRDGEWRILHIHEASTESGSSG